MKDITRLLNHYRECVRHLWNVYFLDEEPSTVDWDLSDEYEEICEKLFSSLVLARIGRTESKKARAFERSLEPLTFLRIIPLANNGVPIHINREKIPSPYWDHPKTLIKPDEADMRFIDFFDFGTLGFREFEYCRVRIVASTANPDLVGHDALLQCNHVTILFDGTQ